MKIVVVLPLAKSDFCFVFMNEFSLIEILKSSGRAADNGLGGWAVQGSTPRQVGRRRTWGASQWWDMREAWKEVSQFLQASAEASSPQTMAIQPPPPQPTVEKGVNCIQLIAATCLLQFRGQFLFKTPFFGLNIQPSISKLGFWLELETRHKY